MRHQLPEEGEISILGDAVRESREKHILNSKRNYSIIDCNK